MTMKRRKVENHDSVRYFSIKPCSRTCLCDDIVSTILLKLPVKSLIRFTSVSKSWNSLIRSPTFIATYNKLVRRRYLLYTPGKPRLGLPFFTSGDEERRSNIKMPHDSYQVVGSCQGLVCVENIHSQVYLWNPLLQTYKILPPSPSQGTITADSCIALGFGYSCNNNDHKVVKIIYDNIYSSSSNKVEIYTLKFDSWKSIDSVAPAIAHGSTGVFINGCINWVATPTSATRPLKTLMWFDIDKESFGEKDFSSQGWMPRSLQEPDQWTQLADLKELLRCVTVPRDCEEEYHHSKSCSLWKMKALACENSRVLLQLNWWDQLKVKFVKIFDGEIIFQTSCKNLFSFLGIDAVTPWEKRDMRMCEVFHVVCVSESLMLLGDMDVSSC